MKIYFKNGKEIRVSQEVVDAINERMLSRDGAKAWQTFAKDGRVYLIINLSEISHIS